MKFRVLFRVMSCRDQVCIEFAKLWSEVGWPRINYLLKKKKRKRMRVSLNGGGWTLTCFSIIISKVKVQKLFISEKITKHELQNCLFIGRVQPRDKSIILTFASYKNICDVAVVSRLNLYPFSPAQLNVFVICFINM